MYCSNCGREISDKAYICVYCGALVNEKPKFYKAGFVLGILSLCIPYYGLILGIIGLPLSIKSKRRSSVIMCIIGIAAWLSIITVLIMFSGIGLHMRY